jgi:hypothetical protein
MSLVIIALCGVMGVFAGLAAARKKRIGDLEKSLGSAREELRRLGEYQKAKEEAQRNADGKKETLHTGDDGTDFANSLKLLHGAAGGDKGA